VTRYLSRIGGSGAGIRPRVRSRFEPAPLAPIDGLGPAISVPPAQPDRDLEAPAWEDDRSASIAEQPPTASPAPALEGGEPPGRDRDPDQPDRRTAPAPGKFTTRQSAAPPPPPLRISTAPGVSPQAEPLHDRTQSGETEARRTTPAEPATTVSRTRGDAAADAPRPATHPPQARRTDAEAISEPGRALSTSPVPAAPADPGPAGRRGGPESSRDPNSRRDQLDQPVTGSPTPSGGSRDEISPPIVPPAPTSAGARPRGPLTVQVPLPPIPGDSDGRAPTHVTVSIDRVEVHAPAASAAPAPPAQRSARRRPPSLDEYMRTRTDRRIG
jgi:hypothetical protein